jgi:hypothetical protein
MMLNKLWFFSLIAVGMPVSLWAKQVTMTCQDEIYICDQQNPKQCVWQLDKSKPELFDLQRNDAYPNANFPYNVWNGTYHRSIQNGQIDVFAMATDHPNWVPVSETVTISFHGMTAGTSGTDNFEGTLRSDTEGVGIYCYSVKVTWHSYSRLKALTPIFKKEALKYPIDFKSYR